MNAAFFFAAKCHGEPEKLYTLIAEYQSTILIDQYGQREDICEFIFADFLMNPLAMMRRLSQTADCESVRIIWLSDENHLDIINETWED